MRLTVCATLAALMLAAAPGLAQQPPAITQGVGPIKRTILARQDIAGTSFETVLVQVDIQANSRIDRHTHPGAVMAHVIEGRFALQPDGEPAAWFAPGETFKIEGGRIHAEFTETAPARILAIFTVSKGQPLATPAAP